MDCQYFLYDHFVGDINICHKGNIDTWIDMTVHCEYFPLWPLWERYQYLS